MRGHKSRSLVGITAILLSACGADGLVPGRQVIDGGVGASVRPDASPGAGASSTGAGGAGTAMGNGGQSGSAGARSAGGANNSSAGEGGIGGGGATGTPDAAVDSGGASGSGGGGGASTGGRRGSGGASVVIDGGNDAGPGGPPDPDLFARTCRKASDCGSGLLCVPSSSKAFDGGGVANGLCTLDCSEDLLAPIPTASACAAISNTALCLQVSDTQAYCTPPCQIGPQSAAKCLGRKDLACDDPSMVGEGYCRPTCRGDFDCGGRVCDLGSGVCVDSLDSARKLPIGTRCNPKAAIDTCEGACVAIADGQSTATIGFCSGFCSLGSTINCGVDPRSTDPMPAYCLFGVDTTSDFGDVGFCAQLCDCNDDCLSPDMICSPVAGLPAVSGRVGACGPAASANDPAGISCL